MTRIFASLFLAVMAISCPQWGLAENNKTTEIRITNSKQDLRVAVLLKQASQNYLVDDAGDYLIRYRVESGEQDVWINSRTAKFLNVEIREIYSIACQVEDKDLNKITQKLLERNSVIMIGAWSIVKAKNNCSHIIFTVKIPADPKAEELSSITDFVAITAGGMKKEMEDTQYNIWTPYPVISSTPATSSLGTNNTTLGKPRMSRNNI